MLALMALVMVLSRLISRSDAGSTPYSMQAGWVRRIRRQKKVVFASLCDGSSADRLQVVFNDPSSCPAEIVPGASVKLSGVLRPSPRDEQPVELHVDPAVGGTAIVLGGMESTGDGYPLAGWGHSPEFLREHPHLRPRTASIAAMLRMRSALAAAIHEYFSEQHFFMVHTPILTTNDCEGGGDTFSVAAEAFERRKASLTEESTDSNATESASSSAFFGKAAHLTVSGQLHAEALATALGRVYTFGPTFRAENSNTPRHLSEFYMLEAEAAFADADAAMALAEGCIRRCGTVLSAKESADFQALSPDNLTWTTALSSSESFARMTYTDAVSVLLEVKDQFKYPVEWGSDLRFEHEQWLATKLHGGPVFVTDYPADLKPFYMRRNDDGKTVSAFDLLVPGVGELAGGSAREDRLDALTARIPPEMANGLQWYTDLRRYGTVPHAGFGIGFERLVQYFSGISNIRDAIPFPRHRGGCRL